MPSESVENYLKAIYVLQERSATVSTSALAEHLQVAPASVSVMVKKLADENPPYLQYEMHRGVRLTDDGMRVALEIIRHHRLLELFLHDHLGYSWDEVHDEAEKLEHFISENFEDKIAEALGHPSFDPHGDPIPTKEGDVPSLNLTKLTDAEVGARIRVRRVVSRNSEVFKYLAEVGVIPGVELLVKEKGPFSGPITIEREDGATHALGSNLADRIYVEFCEENS